MISLLTHAAAAATKTKAAPKGVAPIANAAGATLFTLARKGSKKVVLELVLDADASNADFNEAFARELTQLRPKG